MQLSTSSVSPKSVVLALTPLVFLVTALTAGPAQALQFSFGGITGTAANKLTGQNQLLVDVTDALGGENGTATSVMFKFSNKGTSQSSITQIYFDNSTVLKTMGAINDSDGTATGVTFANATGSNLTLPGGNDLTFQSSTFTADFGIKAKSQGGVANNGVNINEWVSVKFDLTAGKTLASVITDLRSGSLRLGAHVQAFGDQNSASFVNTKTFVVASTPPPPKKVPEASSAIGVILLAGRLALKQRRAVVQAD